MAYNDPNAKSDGDTLDIGTYNILRNNWLASVLAVVSTKGDLAVATAANAVARLAAGSAGDELTPDSGETTGLKWQIRPACRVYNSGDIAIGGSSWTNLTFDSERYDTNGMHSTGTNPGRLTCPTNGDGIYHISGHVRLTQDGDLRVRIILNGATVIAEQSHFYDSGSGPSYIDFSISADYELAATDYLQLEVYCGSAETAKAASNFSPEFSATWLRPAS
jgi:hypothetical protein